MRLNLACGDDWRREYVNVDLRPDAGDETWDVSCLPVDDETVKEILALDILEHFPRSRISAVLAEWRRVLEPGGLLTVRVPNLTALATLLLNGGNPDSVARNLVGGHRWGPDGAWDAHHWLWTPETLERDLTAAGFHVLDNDHSTNMTLNARKPDVS